MEYPKPVMKLSELKKMGFPEKWLRYVYRMQGNRGIAWKNGIGGETSHIMFDTEALEKYRKAHCVGR